MGGEGVVAGDIEEVAGVVEGVDADVSRAAEFEPVYSAVRGYDPGRLFRRPVDRTHQVQRDEADSTGV